MKAVSLGLICTGILCWSGAVAGESENHRYNRCVANTYRFGDDLARCIQPPEVGQSPNFNYNRCVAETYRSGADPARCGLKPPMSVSSLLQNLRAAGDECLLFQQTTFSKDGMLQLTGAQDAEFFNHSGDYARPEDFSGSVQVRAGDFSGVLPEVRELGVNMQVVGASGSGVPFLSFIISRRGIAFYLSDVEKAVGANLSYVKVPLPMLTHVTPGVPSDLSYYQLERTNPVCRYKLSVHFTLGQLDQIGLKEERP